jgi:hypothetical protein
MASTLVGRARAGHPSPSLPLRSVALPAEHGGWGLTIEPGLLGLLLRPSLAGVAIAAAGIVAFLLRTPLKLVAIDHRRRRWLPRTRLAARVSCAEAAFLGLLIAIAMQGAASPFWWPALIAAPLLAVEATFEVRSRGRRLVPELAGAVAVGSLAAMVVLAGGGDARLAIGAWVLLAARSIASIPDVRAQVARLHGRPVDEPAVATADLVALATAATAVLVEPELVAGAIAVFALVALQEVWSRRPAVRATIIGVRQLLLGVFVVVMAAGGAGLLGP